MSHASIPYSRRRRQHTLHSALVVMQRKLIGLLRNLRNSGATHLFVFALLNYVLELIFLSTWEKPMT